MSKHHRPGNFALAAISALILLMASCGPAARLFVQGGQRQLGKNLHPTRPGPRMIVFALDGAGYAQFMEAVHSGKAPHIAALLGRDETGDVFAHAYSVPNAIAILPTTLPAWTATFTGVSSGYNGISGDEFFVRSDAQFYAPVPVSVQSPDDALMMMSSDLLGKMIESPTVFEQLGLRSYVSLNGVYRGADVFTGIDRAAYAALVATLVREKLRDSRAYRALFAKVDESSVNAIINNIRSHGFADLQVVYFPGIDLFTHRAVNGLDAQVRYLEQVTDKSVGEIIAYYRKHGELNNTYVLFIADHGHTPVLEDDRHALGNHTTNDLPRLLERTGFRVRPLKLAPATRDYQAVAAYEGVMAYIYLADRSSCPAKGEVCDWKKPPRLKEDVMPVVRALYRSNASGQPIAEFRGALDLIFAREPVAPGHDTRTFEIFNGTKLVPIYRYLWEHPRPDLVDLGRRIRWLSQGPYGDRAGDIVVLPRFNITLPIAKRFYFGPPYHSEHGSPSMQDSHIPFVVACPTRSGRELRQIVKRKLSPEPSQLDVVPLIKSLLRASPRLKRPVRGSSLQAASLHASRQQ